LAEQGADQKLSAFANSQRPSGVDLHNAGSEIAVSIEATAVVKPLLACGLSHQGADQKLSAFCKFTASFRR
jgi:hypothetical protein